MINGYNCKYKMILGSDKNREDIELGIAVWSLVASTLIMIAGISYFSIRDILKYDQ